MEIYKEQAARVKLMADAWNLPEADCDAIRAVLYRLEALEEALKFYADPESWHAVDMEDYISGTVLAINEETPGDCARKALEATP